MLASSNARINRQTQSRSPKTGSLKLVATFIPRSVRPVEKTLSSVPLQRQSIPETFPATGRDRSIVGEKEEGKKKWAGRRRGGNAAIRETSRSLVSRLSIGSLRSLCERGIQLNKPILLASVDGETVFQCIEPFPLICTFLPPWPPGVDWSYAMPRFIGHERKRATRSAEEKQTESEGGNEANSDSLTECERHGSSGGGRIGPIPGARSGFDHRDRPGKHRERAFPPIIFERPCRAPNAS